MSYNVGTGFSLPFPNSFLLPETMAYYNRCYSPKPNIILVSAINILISTLQKTNIWDIIDAFHIYSQNNVDNVALNLKGDYLTLTPTVDPAPFFLSNYGITGNGSTFSYALGDAYNLPNYSRDSASMFVWSLNSVPSTSSIDIGASSTSDGVLSRASIRTLDGRGISASIYANSDTALTLSTTTPYGFTGWSRTSSTDVIGFKSGNVFNFTQPSTDLPLNYISILRLSNGLSSFSSNSLALSIVGGGLTQPQISILYNACLDFLIDIGVINPDIPPEPEALTPGWWTKSTMDLVKAANGSNFRVYQQALPPRTNSITNNTYLYFPLSDTDSQQVDAFQPAYSSQNYIRNHHHIWQMRSVVPPNSTYNDRPSLQPPGQINGVTANLVKGSPPLQCWVQYGNFDKADAATQAQIRFTLGYPAHNPGYETDPLLMGYMDVANNAGIPDSDVWTWQYAYANLDTFWTQTYTSRARTQKFYVVQNKIILPDSRLCDSGPMATGVVLDAEAQDGRSPQRQLALLQNLAAICQYKGYEFTVYTNPLNGTGARNTGFTIDSLPQIVQTPNLYLTVVAWPANIEKDITQSLNNQLDLLKGPNGSQPIDYSKLIMELAIGPQNAFFNAAQCAIVRSYVQRGMKGVLVWRDYGSPGGSITRYYNQVLANVLGLPNT